MFQPPEKVKSLVGEFEYDWFIAGGWAIDLFLGRETRAHDDVEIAIFRQDQLALQKVLRDWNLQKAVGGKLSEWQSGDFLQLPVHAVHCFNETEEFSFFEVLLNESENGAWQYRRDRRITKSLSEIYLTNDSGIRFLCPEIVLLYKSKNPRAKDKQDFRATFDFLSRESRIWLKNALMISDAKHSWLSVL